MVSLWPFGKNTQIEKQPTEDVNLTVSLGGSLFSAGAYEDTTQNASLSYYADVVSQNPIVFSCVREISTSVASVEYNTVVRTREGEFADFYGPLHDLMEYPNEDQNIVDFIELMVEQLLVFGNAYMYLERQGQGGPTARVGALRLLRPDWVTIKLNKEGTVESYVYSPDAIGSGTTIPASDIGHLRYPNTTTGKFTGTLYGISPLSVIKNDTILDALLSDLSMNFMKRGAVPTGLLKLKKRITSMDDANAIRERWKSTFSGTKGQWNVAVLDSDSSYESLQALPKDLAMQESRDIVETKICGVLGVPPIIIGAGVGLRRSTYSNYKQALASYRDETVAPLCQKIERFFNQTLASQFSGSAIVQVDFSNAPAWQENESEKATRMTSLYDSGVISLNEARQTLGFDSLTNGDIRRTPSNLFEIGINERLPVLPAPEEKMLPSKAEKALRPSDEAQSPPVVHPASGPVPIPHAQELIVGIRQDEQKRVDKLAKAVQTKYFTPIRNRLNGVVGRRLDDETIYGTEYPFKEEELVPPGMEEELAIVLRAAALGVSIAVFKQLAESGFVPTSEFNERNFFIQQALQGAMNNAELIHVTTTETIKAVLDFGVQNSLTIRDVVQGGVQLVTGKPYKGLRGVLADASKNRVPTISRTQIARATNLASLAYYQQMGADYVQCIDGDEFDERCIDRNGKVFTLEEAEQQEEHPNGIMDFVPALEFDAGIGDLVPRLEHITETQKTSEVINA